MNASRQTWRRSNLSQRWKRSCLDVGHLGLEPPKKARLYLHLPSADEDGLILTLMVGWRVSDMNQLQLMSLTPITHH